MKVLLSPGGREVGEERTPGLNSWSLYRLLSHCKCHQGTGRRGCALANRDDSDLEQTEEGLTGASAETDGKWNSWNLKQCPYGMPVLQVVA